MKEKLRMYEVRNGAFLPRPLEIEELIKRINSNNLNSKTGPSKFFLRKHQAYEYLYSFKRPDGTNGGRANNER